MRRSTVLLLAALVLAALAVPLVARLPYHRDLVIKVLLFGMLAQAWNILAGYCGQISLGSGAFMAIGAYSAYKLGTGVRVLGGFTTFSSFSMETFNLIAQAAYGRALLNVTLSIALCIGATWLGVLAGRQL